MDGGGCGWEVEVRGGGYGWWWLVIVCVVGWWWWVLLVGSGGSNLCILTNTHHCQPPILVGSSGWHQCVNEYLNIFEYSNIFLRILIFVFDSMQFPEAEYYSNIRIFCSNISEYLSSKITRNTEILKVSVSFLT